MGGSPMKIFLTPGEKEPFRISTARPVPHHWEEKARKVIQQLIDSKVIATMSDPSDWCAPGFFVAKNNGELRLVVDFTGLNKYVCRPIHTFPSSSDIFSGLDPQAQFFAKLDATQGYHQVPLDHDSSKLTTFLLPHGRFRFLRAPMDLSCSSDEFCRRSDEVVRNLPGIRKLVDDILVQAPTPEALKNRISELLQRCRKHHFTLSQKKFEIGRKVNFAGFVVSRDGVFPNPDKLQGIRDFPAPSDISSLRSFLGMINQLNNFYPYLASLSIPLLTLLSKDVSFVWLPEHQAAFQLIKSKLTEDLALHHFDPSLPTMLLTDASRLHGVGFILVQTPKIGTKRVIKCGSRSLTPAETNYATIELETLAILSAVLNCDFFLKGMQHFEVCTDHHPLLGTFSKPLSCIYNPRIVCQREKVLDYNFSITWVAGKDNIIADALSRSVPKPQSVPHRLLAIHPASTATVSMATIIEHANSCPTYFKIKNAHDISHELSSPYHPEPNGQTESAVKNVKHLMEKVKPSEFPSAFAAWKNTRWAHQPSPNELFFGRQLRIQLPLMRSTLCRATSTQRAPLLTQPGSGPCLLYLRDKPSGYKTRTPGSRQQKLLSSPPAAQVVLTPSRRKKPRPSLATGGSLGPNMCSTVTLLIRR